VHRVCFEAAVVLRLEIEMVNVLSCWAARFENTSRLQSMKFLR